MSVGSQGTQAQVMGLKGPHLRYPCRDSDEIYELYDDVEPSDSRSSLKGRGLLAAGLDPARPGTWDTPVAGAFSAMLLV